MPAKSPESAVTAPPYPAEDPIERIILRSMNEGVITLECNGTVHTVNPAALRILGLSQRGHQGQALPAGFWPRARERRIHEHLPRGHTSEFCEQAQRNPLQEK